MRFHEQGALDNGPAATEGTGGIDAALIIRKSTMNSRQSSRLPHSGWKGYLPELPETEVKDIFKFV